MANLQDLLKKKSKASARGSTKKAGIAPRKRIERKGPTRPWQENLDEYKSGKSGQLDSGVDLEAAEGPSGDSVPPPTPTINSGRIGHPRKANNKPNQIRTDSESIPNHKQDAIRIKSESIPNLKSVSRTSGSSYSGELEEDHIRIENESIPNQENLYPNGIRIKSGFNSDIDLPMPQEMSRPTDVDSDGAAPNAVLQESVLTNPRDTIYFDQASGHQLTGNLGSIPNQNRIVSEPIPNQNRTETNGIPNRNGSISESQTESIPNQNRTISESKPSRSFNTHDFAKLSDMKQAILNIVFKDCQSVGNRVTRPFRVKALSEEVGCRYDSCRNAIRQLERAGLINRVSTKRGRGGFVQIEMAEHVYTCISAYIHTGIYRGVSEPNPNQIRINSELQTESQTESNGSSKLVSNLNSPNLTKKESMEAFYEEVDFTPIDESRFLKEEGLYRTKIIGEISKNRWNITPDELSQIIEKFAVYSGNKDNIYNIKSIKGFFFKQCKRVHEGEVLDVDQAETSEDKDLKKLREKMLVRKAAREQLKAEIMELAFDDWWETTAEHSRKELCPEVYKMDLPDEVVRKGVKGKWASDVWPTTEDFKNFVDASR